MGLNEYDEAVEDLPGSPNPYERVATERFGGHATAMRVSQQQAQDLTPDAAAEALKLSQRTGLPPELVGRNLEAIRKRATIADTPYAQMQRETPTLATFLEQPHQAAVVKDDLENMGLLEWLVTAPQRAFAQTIDQQKYANLRYESMFRPLTQAEHDQMESARFGGQKGDTLGANTWFRKAVTGTASFLANQVPIAEYALVGGAEVGAAGAAAGSILPGAGTLAGGVAGFGYGAGAGALYGVLKSTFRQESANAYDEYLQFRDELGRPLDPEVAKAAALAVGAINAPIEAGAQELLLRSIPGVSKLGTVFARSAVKQALLKPTIRAALADAVKTYGTTLAGETAQEVAQRAVTILAGELAKATGETTLAPGQLEAGNINLNQQPRVQNADGTTSTVDSVGVNVDGKELLLPTVTPDGRHFAGTDEEKTTQAVEEYQKTGRHLGVFASPEASTAYAQQLHEDYAAGKFDQPTRFRTGADIVSDLGHEAVGALQSFALGVAGGPLLGGVQGVQRARRAQHTAAFFTALGEGVTQSKTVQRAPEVAEAFLQRAAQGGPLKTVYAPIDTFTQYWQGKGIDPAEIARTLTGSADAYEQAVRTGEKLAIPTSRYAVTLAGTEHNAFFANELSLGPDEMNAREVEAFKQEQAALAANPPAAPEPSGVHQAITEQLVQGGKFSPETAAPIAQMFESTFTNLAERAGEDVMSDLYQPYGLQVERPDLLATAPAGSKAAAFRDKLAAMRAARATVDTQASTAQTEGEHAAGSEAGEGVSPAGGDAGDGIAASTPRVVERATASGTRLIRETPEERATREREHYHAVFAYTVTRARALDPAVNPADLRAEFEFRLNAYKELQAAYEESGRDPLDLLRAISQNGGIFEPESGQAGEVRALKDGLKFGAAHGIKGIFRSKTEYDDRGAAVSGLGLDLMLQRLQQDGRFHWLEDINMLVDAIDDAIRHEPEGDTFPGTKELRRAVNITPETTWWIPSWRPVEEEPATDAVDAGGGDDTFNIVDFGQGLFDALEDEQPTVDTLDTGEQQPRLPGAEAARDVENKTPEFEAPFSLTAPVAKGSKGKQTTLFQPGYHGSPHIFEQFSLHAIGSGEGAQAYGWGLYFASKKEVADGYRERLAGKASLVFPSLTVDENRAIPDWIREHIQYAIKVGAVDTSEGLKAPTQVVDTFIAQFKERVDESRQELKTRSDYWNVQTMLRAQQGVVDALEKLKASGDLTTAINKPGRTYVVEIPENEDYLDWDKPASQQSEKVQAALKALGVEWTPFVPKTLKQFRRWMDTKEFARLWYEDVGIREELSHARYYAETGDVQKLDSWQRLHQGYFAKGMTDPSGEYVYDEIKRKVRADKGWPSTAGPMWQQEAKYASQALASQGVAGIRYLDGFSRVAGEGSHNFVVFDDKLVQITEYYQPERPDEKATERRGSIRFGPDRKFTISLLEKADLSTFLHESGHFFLEVFGDVVDRIQSKDPATLTGSQKKLASDYATLLESFGVTSRSAITVEHHEQFARQFEAYLMTGQAPSLALRSTYATFRAWLVGIYRSLKSLGVKLTPEVTGVLDRLIASDQAIAEVEAQRDVAPMFLTAAEAGMSEDRFALYRDTIANASRAARERLDVKLLADVQRLQTAAWQARRDEIEAAVQAEVYQDPAYRAMAAMQRGTQPDGSALVEGMESEPLKLSRAILVERYGEQRLKQLPKPYVYTRDGGLDPNVVAEMFGFSSGDALLTAIEQAPPMRQVIAAETSRRMTQEHGDLMLDGTLHERAQAAVANEDRDIILRAELRALNELRRTVEPFVKPLEDKARRGPSTIRAGIPAAAVLRDTARARIAATPIRQLKPQTFWSASRKAAQLAIDAAARQDFDAAIAAKTQELVNLNLYREAERALDDLDTRVQFAKGLAKPATRASLGFAGHTYLDQVDAILDRFEFAKVSQKVLDRRASLRKFVESLEAQGLPVDLPDEVLDEAFRKNYQELTVEQLVGVTDGLKHLVYIARNKNRMLKAAERREFQAERDTLVESIRTHNVARDLPVEFRPEGEKYRFIGDLYASHAKISMLARSLDGHADGGAMWEAIIRPINEASDAEVTRKAAAGKALWKIVEQYYPGRELGRLNEQLEIPAIHGSLSKEGRIAVALNWGNETSRDRLLNDPQRKWTREQVLAILDTLDQRDWQFVQATWDFLDTFWPEIAAKQERVTGLAPEKVEASPVDTKFGTFKGGYYPLAYDPRLNARAAQLEAATEAKQLTSAAYVRTTTKRGHVEARKSNVRLSVRLDLGVAFNHVEQVIHDLTHHETLIDVTRLLRDGQVSDAILKTKGDAVYRQFTTALQDIAGGLAPSKNFMDRAATWARTGTQLALLGWNLWTGVQQTLGVFNGARRVGPAWVARGMRRWLTDAASLENTLKWITSVSPMMRERVTTGSQDLSDLRTELRRPGGWFDTLVRRVSLDTLTQQTITDGFLWHIGLMQRVADVPTWLGAYEKAMAADPSDEKRALALADQAVLDSQGGGQIKDLANVQRGGPVARLFMTFYSYGSVIFNETVDAAGKTNFKSPASVIGFLGDLSLLYVMPAVGTIALSRFFGRTEGDDPESFLEDVGHEILATALNTMVLVRELQGAFNEGARGYAGPAGARLIELLYKASAQIKQGKADEALWHAVNAAAGVIFRYPSAQVQRTVDGWVALEEGKTHNPAALLFGPPPKRERHR